MSKTERALPFHPYYTVKDTYAVAVFAIAFFFIVFFLPNYFSHPDKYLEANPMVTPPHIVPEWYLLPFYAILRAIPSKIGGVIAMFGAILVLFVIPWLDLSPVRSARYRPIYKWFFWAFVFDALALGYIGSQPAVGSWVLWDRSLRFTTSHTSCWSCPSSA